MIKNKFATQDWTSEQLELIEKYGTTDVYVLQEGIDYAISNDVSSAHFRFSNGTIGTLKNFNYAKKTIVFPEGIIVIGESRLSNLIAKGIIMPSSLVEIKEDAFAKTTSLQSVKFNDNNVTDILIGSQAFFNCRYLHKIKLSNKIHFNFDSAVFSNGTVIEGYAGSDAEKYCEKYGNDFINIGSEGGGGNVFIGTKTSEDQSDIDAINSIVASEDIEEGDFCIVKTEFSSGLYFHKGFVYNGETWEAMDGNYDAENVYFKEDIVLAGSYTAVGNITKSSNTATGTLSAAGKSVKDIIQSIFTKELQPSNKPTNPAVTITLTNAGAKEVGTPFNPEYSASLSAGSYTYGPATGIIAKSWAISDSNGNTSTSSAGVFTSFVVDDNTNYTVTAKATHDAGPVATTNLGNPSNPEVKIAAGEKSKTSSAVTGFRYTFYGSNTTPITLDSTNIRKLSGKTTDNTFSIDVVEGATQVVIAIPTGKTLSKVEDTGAFGTDIVGSFNNNIVEVSGITEGENMKEYNVYVYSPDAALGANTYDVTVE